MSSLLRVGVLSLQGDVREHLYRLRDTGVEAVEVRHPADLTGTHGLVIPGGESTTMSILAERDGFFEPLQQYRRNGRPCFGSCAGLIMLADEVLDGRAGQRTVGGLDIAVRRNAFGRQVDSFESEIDVIGLSPQPFPAIFIRAPWVERVGSGVEVLAVWGPGRTPVAVRQGPLLATAFHPELTTDLRVHQMFVDTIAAYA